MGFCLKENACKKIFVAAEERESVRFAVQDIMEDIRAVCGDVVCTSDEAEADIIVRTEQDRFSHEEEFAYTIKGDKIYFSGANDLGTMWALYTFSEKELGISPMCYFDGFKAIRKKTLCLEDKIETDYPRTRFRGWFINDEDLLSGFKNKGERDVDYFFYKKVISHDLMEKIVETALRHRMNLLIPASLLDIENPFEVALLDIIARRGMYISQHHIEPLGVSHYGMRAFMQTNGYNAENISFVSSREGMEAAWRHYVQAWAKYPRVVWQLGLRGNSDVPVWASDKSVGESDEERGALISDAIFTQYDIIKKASKGEVYTSMTLWMESAALLGKGVLKVPQDTILVFSDIGASQMFGEDFFAVQREQGRDYGVYYHAGYWNVGPHLAESLLPEKMAYCYTLAHESAVQCYSMLNVANIKEFPFSIGLNSKIVFDGVRSVDAYAEEYCNRFPLSVRERLKIGIAEYYASFGDIGEEEYRRFCRLNDFHYHGYAELSFPVYALNDGFLCWYIRRPFEDNIRFFNPCMKKVFEQGLEHMVQARVAFFDVYRILDTDGNAALQQAFARGWLYQSIYWTELLHCGKEVYSALENAKFGDGKAVKKHFASAAEYADKILAARKTYYQGEWAQWFSFDKKLDIPQLASFLRERTIPECR